MAEDIQSNIHVNIDTSDALASIKNLQRQISAFHTQMAQGSAANAAAAANLEKNLLNNLNATGKFSASIAHVKTTTEAFTESLEKNKFSMGEYFRYAGAASKTFGRLFTNEFNTIEKVARERVKSLQTQYIKMGRDANGAVRAIAVRPLMLDMDSLATKTAIAAQKQQLMNQLLKQGSTNLLNFGKNTQWAGRQLMVGFTVPLTMLGSVASKVFMDMEQQVIKFKRVYGDMNTLASDTDKMANSIRQLAAEYTKYGVAVADTMQMAADAAAMGKQGNDLLAQVNQAARLSVLGGVDQQKALETTISLTNAFGVSAEQLTGKVNFLNAVENQTVTSIEDLTTAIPKAAPVIKQLGGNVEDLAFFLTAMREGGINASEGANALKSGLASMINPTKQASDMLMGFGVNVKGIVEANRGDVKGMVIGLATALDKLDPLNRARGIEQLFGKFQFARISTLFQNIVKDGSQAATVLELTRNSAEELAILSEREMKRISDSPMYKFQKAIEDIKVSLMPLGEAFLKAVTPIIKFGTDILNKFNGMDEGVKGFVVSLVGIAGVVAPALLMGFGLIANGVANVIKFFTMLKDRFNNAGKSSSDLTEQTKYMTQAQIDAAAQAASLDQAHAKLIGTFSSEAAAVRDLIATYQQAVTAQAAFSANNVIPRGPVNNTKPQKKASGGIISGPGSGTSDSIPAMLSNGEAVIPADKVQKYGGLIKGIIAGNIPGYAKSNVGNINVGGQDYAIEASGQAELVKIQNAVKSLSKGLVVSEDTLSEAVRILSTGSKRTIRDFQRLMVTIGELDGTSRQDILTQGFGLTNKQAGKFKGSSAAYTAPAGGMKEEARLAGESNKYEATKRIAEAEAKAYIEALIKEGMSRDEATKKGESLNKTDRSHIIPVTDADKMLKSAWGTEVAPMATGPSNNFASALGMSKENSKFLTDSITKMSKAGVPGLEDTTDLLYKLKNDLALSDDEAKQLAITLQNLTSAENIDATRAATKGRFIPQALAAIAGQAQREIELADKEKLPNGLITNPTQEQISANKAARIAEKAKILGMSVNQGTADGITSSQTVLTAASDKSSQSLLQRFKTFWGIASPSRKMFEFGEDMNQGLADGINASSNLPENAAQQTSNNMDYIFGETGNTSQMPQTKGTVGQRAKDMLSGIKGHAKEFGTAAGIALKEKAKDTGETVGVGFARYLTGGKVNLVDRNGTLRYNAETGQRFDKNGRAIANEKLLDKIANMNANRANFSIPSSAKYDKSGRVLEGSIGMSDFVTDANGQIVMRGRGKNKTPMTQEQAAAKGNFRSQTANVSRYAMGATAIVGMATQIQGPIGDAAKGAIGPLTAMTTAMSTIPGPAGLVVGVIASIATAFIQLKATFDNAQQEVVDYADKFKASNKSVMEMAKFSGKVTASEIMDRRRAERDRQLGSVAGKKTFGETYIQSEAGKALVANISKQNAAGKGAQAQQDLQSQLTAGVLSGAITAGQAKSMAMNIATQAGDQALGLRVVANLDKVLGPNGEDLAKNPLSVRMNLVDQSNKQIKTSMGAANSNPGKGFGTTGGQFGSIMAGAGAGALIGGALTAWLGPGAAIGAALGSMVGAVGGYFAAQEQVKLAGRLGAAAAVDAKIALENNKQMLDSLDLNYQKKIDELKAQGKINEAEALQNRYIRERNSLTGKMATTNKLVLSSYDKADPSLRPALMSGMQKATNAKYKDNPDQLAYVDATRAQIESLKGKGLLRGGQQYLIEAKMASGEIPPATMKNLLAIAGDDKELVAKTMSIMTKFTGDTTARTGDLGSLLVNAKGEVDKTVQKNFLIKVDAQTTDADAQDLLNNVSELTKLNTVIPSSVLVDFYMKDDAAYAKLNDTLDKLNANKTHTIAALLKITPEIVGAMSEADKAYYNTLTDEQKAVYEKSITSTLYVDPKVIVASEDFKKWLTTETTTVNGVEVGGSKWAGSSTDVQVAHYRTSEAYTATKDAAAIASAAPTTKPTTTGGGGTNPLDEITNKLKQVRDAAVNATGGIKELRRLLGGKLDMTIFSGMDQQLTRLGASGGFTDWVMGLDKKEQNKYLKFTDIKDKKGKVITQKISLTPDGQVVDKAFNEIAMGEFSANNRRIITGAKDQLAARTKLIAAGLSYSESVKVAENRELAHAIAVAKDKEEVKKLVDEYKGRIAAEESLKTAQDKFQEAYDKAKKYFSVKKEKIQLEFDLDPTNIANQKAIKAAERAIEDIQLGVNGQTGLNDYNNGLSKLQFREDEINKKYDERQKALTKIQEINQAINEQQKDQLSLASALSSGDISAAADAALQMQQNDSQRAADQQQKSLEIAREKELSNLSVDVNGKKMTRAEIEKESKILQEKILDIQIKQLEPAKEAITLATRLKDDKIALLDAEEKTWEALKNGIDNAEVSAKGFLTTVEAAKALALEAQAIFNSLPTSVPTPTGPSGPSGPTGGKSTGATQTKATGATQTKATGATQSATGATQSAAGLSGLKNAVATSTTSGGFYNGSTFVPTVSNTIIKPSASVATAADKNGWNAVTVVAKNPGAGNSNSIAFNPSQNQSLQLPAGAVVSKTTTFANGSAMVTYTMPIKKAMGGLVPKYFASGGAASGTDTVPAMLTPGEFVVRKFAVDNFGVDNLRAINNGASMASGAPTVLSNTNYDGSVYNYSVNVNVKSDANPDQIAGAVMQKISQINSQRIRGNRL